jgi:hypothetical protein
MLSRARKYKLGLVLAHQQTGQLSKKLLDEIFGNVSTFIAFNVGHDDAGKLSREYAYEVGIGVEYVDPGEFLRLKTGEAIVKIARTVFPMETYLLPKTADPRRGEYIIERSRRNYGKNGKPGAPEAKVKRPDKILLPQKSPEDIDPKRVF